MLRRIDDSVFSEIANAIRLKNGTSNKYEVSEMTEAINKLPEQQNCFVYDINLGSNITDKNQPILSDPRLIEIRDLPNLTISLVPKTTNIMLTEENGKQYIGFVIGSNHTINGDDTSVSGIVFRKHFSNDKSGWGPTAFSYGINQQYGSSASSTNAGHLYIDESGNLTMQLSTTYILGAGDYLITVSW